MVGSCGQLAHVQCSQGQERSSWPGGTLAGGFMHVHPYPLEAVGQLNTLETPNRPGDCQQFGMASYCSRRLSQYDTAEEQGSKPK